MSGMLGESSQSLPILAPLWHFNERCTVISSSLSIGQSKTDVHYFIACRWEQQIAWQYDDDYDDNDDDDYNDDDNDNDDNDNYDDDKDNDNNTIIMIIMIRWWW